MSAVTQEDQKPIAYNVQSAARLADCSEATIRRAIDAGYLDAVKPRGTAILRIPRESLQQWLAGE